MAQPITDGLYLIRPYGDDGLLVGSVLPKTVNESVGAPQRIDTLPAGVAPQQWHIYKLESGGWGLSVRGAVTFPLDEKIYGLPMPFDHGHGWKLDPKPQYGPDVYTISSFSDPKEKGWVLPSKEAYTQVAFRHLIVGPSLPPKYPESELFIINRILVEA